MIIDETRVVSISNRRGDKVSLLLTRPMDKHDKGRRLKPRVKSRKSGSKVWTRFYLREDTAMALFKLLRMYFRDK